MAHNEESEIYCFLDASTEYKGMDTLPIKILVDPYKDVEFRFTRISMLPIQDSLSINFDIELLKTPANVNVSVNDESFVDFLGNILYDIVVNREDITAQVDTQGEPVDLEADVHEEPHGKDHS